jgi:two-component system, OmpR family, response regulator
VVFVRILVVEDSEKMLGLIRRGLEEVAFAVDVARDGDEALWFATEHPYDAIVLDVTLGGTTALDGFEVCRSLRRLDCWSPVLMLTARDAVQDRVRGLDAGADDYLTKPFSFDELVARVRALIRRGAEPRPAVLRVGDLSLDPATHRVARGDRQIELTGKEFALLEFLMRHPGEVFRRATLIEHVWDFAHDGDSNLIDVHIRNLRMKIDRPFGLDSIDTIRSVGYRLRDATLDDAPA